MRAAAALALAHGELGRLYIVELGGRVRVLVGREPLTVPAGIYSFAEDTRGELYFAAMDGRVWRLVAR